MASCPGCKNKSIDLVKESLLGGALFLWGGGLCDIIRGHIIAVIGGLMDFYTLAYVQSQASTRQLWALIVFAAILLALLVVGIQVLRNGFTSRYRDLTVILSLIVVFFLGFEYQQYSRMKNTSEDFSRVMQFMNAFSVDHNVDTSQLAIDSLRMKETMVLRVGDAHYQVHFNPSYTTYTLERVYTVSPQDRIIDKQ